MSSINSPIKPKTTTPTTTPQTTTSGGAGPKPDDGVSSVDDDPSITDIDAAKGQSVSDGMSMEPAVETKRKPFQNPASIEWNPSSMSATRGSATSSLSGSSSQAPTKVDEAVKTSDTNAVGRMLSASIGQLEKGEKAVVGAKAGFAEELAVEGEAHVEISRRKDGKYEVKLDQRAFVGVGVENNVGTQKTGSRAGLVEGAELVFVADTQEEAASIATAVVAAAALGNAVMPLVGAAVGVLLAGADTGKLAEVKYELGLGAAVEAEAKLADAEVKLEAGVEGTMALVYEATTGEVYLEVSSAIEGEAAAGQHGAVLAGGELEGRITVRVPLGRVTDPGVLADPEMQKKLIAEARLNPATTTMKFEGKVVGGAVAEGAAVEVEKEIKGNRLDELFASGGWSVQVDGVVGPKLGGGIGPASGEVAAQRHIKIYEPDPGQSLEAQLKDVADHKSQIENKLLKEKQKETNRTR